MTALAVTDLDKSFGGLRVTSNVSLRVEPGERRLIIGPNGAGKTTLFNLITGELRPDRGSVSLFDRDITRVPSRRRFHLGMARTYQIITLFPGETLLRNVTLALLGRSRRALPPPRQLLPPLPCEPLLRNVTLALLGLSRLRWNPLVRLAGQRELIGRARETLARGGLQDLAEPPLLA